MRPSLLCRVAIVVAGLCSASFAHATEGEALVAQSLFEEGRALMDAGRFPEACAKLARSHALDPSGGTLLELAVCREREGRLATANVVFERALAQATVDQRQDRAALAREHLEALRPRLPRLAIEVGAGAPEGLVVELDGVMLPVEAWGTPVAVDPSEHAIAARAPGKVAAEVRVTVTEGESIRVAVPALAAAPTVGVPRRADGSRQRTVGIVSMIGGAALLGGSIAGLSWAADHSISRLQQCKPYCPEDEVDDARTAETVRDVSTVGVIFGAGAILGGGIAFLVAPRATSSSPQVAAGPGTIRVSVPF